MLAVRDLEELLMVYSVNIIFAKTEKRKRQAIRDQAMIYLMAYAGLRGREIVALNWEDIILHKRSGTVIVRDGNSRVVKFNSETKGVVSYWRDITGAGAGSCAVFIGKQGRITTRTVQRRVEMIGRQVGIDVTPHDLRETFARRLLVKNVPLMAVQQLLGHARTETTARYVQ